MYCNDIGTIVMDALKPGVYKDEEWRLFIDSSHYSHKKWLLRISFKPDLKNIKQTPLVNLERVLLPPLHIK